MTLTELHNRELLNRSSQCKDSNARGWNVTFRHALKSEMLIEWDVRGSDRIRVGDDLLRISHFEEGANEF